jgi:hypothetical protein
MQHLDPLLQHLYENTCNLLLKSSETVETYVCNIRFQRNIFMLLERMEAHWRVEFIGGSGPG